VDVVGKKVENQVQFWSLLGPSLVLLSIAVLLFKVSEHWYFSISALIGIPLCVKWKIKGMAVALGCLLLFSGFGYQNLELDDRYWHVGLVLTMAFSFIVLTLSSEEAQSLINKLQLESQSRLDNFALLDEKWKSAEQDWSTEREKFKVEIASSSQEIAKIQEEKQTFYKLAQLAKDEIVQVRGQYDQLLHDLLYKKKHIAQLNERLEEMEITIQGFVNSDTEKQIQSLAERLINLEQENETLKAKEALTQNESQAWQQENKRLLQEFEAIQEREKAYLEQKKIHLANRAKQQPQENLPYASGNTRGIEGMYIQLKEQFQEKCNVLDSTRKELFHAHEKLLKCQKEREEEQIYGQSSNERLLERNLLEFGRQYEQMHCHYQQEIEAMDQLVKQLLEQLSLLYTPRE
jgi:chromosome segregation ATPase